MSIKSKYVSVQHYVSSVPGSQKKVLGAAMWVLGIKPRPSGTGKL